MHSSRSLHPIIRVLLFAVLHLLLLQPQSARSIEIVDNGGIAHHFEQPAERIISLYPAHTENPLALGASSSLLGISRSDTIPESLPAIARYSHHDSLEKFIAADPDCILIRPMIERSKPDLIRKLRAYGIPVISLQPTSFTELYPYWRALGSLSGTGAKAENMIATFNKELEEIRSVHADLPHSQRPRVYFESIHARMRTFSPDSISIFTLQAAGGINIAVDAVSRHGTNIAGYSKERILAKSHEIDVFLAQSGRMNRITVDMIVNEPGFGAIKAVRENRVYLIDEDLVSRPTIRLLEGIRQIQQLIHHQPLS